MVRATRPRTDTSARLLHGPDTLELALEAVESSIIVALQVPADKEMRREPRGKQHRSHPTHLVVVVCKTNAFQVCAVFERSRPFRN